MTQITAFPHFLELTPQFETSLLVTELLSPQNRLSSQNQQIVVTLKGVRA